MTSEASASKLATTIQVVYLINRSLNPCQNGLSKWSVTMGVCRCETGYPRYLIGSTVKVRLLEPKRVDSRAEFISRESADRCEPNLALFATSTSSYRLDRQNRLRLSKWNKPSSVEIAELRSTGPILRSTRRWWHKRNTWTSRENRWYESVTAICGEVEEKVAVAVWEDCFDE